MKKYYVVSIMDGERFESVKTEKELAEHWQSNNDAGYLDEIIAFCYNPATCAMERVNVYEIARTWLDDRAEIEREYRDYCDTVREYGYDYN